MMRRHEGPRHGAAAVALAACAPGASPPRAGGDAGPAGGLATSAATTPPAGSAVATPGAAESLEQIVAAARQEGQITLTWSENVGSREGIRRWIEGFNPAYGLSLDVRYTPGPAMPELANKIAQ